MYIYIYILLVSRRYWVMKTGPVRKYFGGKQSVPPIAESATRVPVYTLYVCVRVAHN